MSKIKINTRNSNNVIATDFCECPQFVENLCYFISYDAFFYYTDNRYFKKLSQRDFNKILLRFCETQYPGQGFSSAQLRDITELIKLKVEREAEKEDTQYLAFNDCLYNTRTHETELFDNKKLCTWSSPYNLSDTKMEIPLFKKFLESSLVEELDHGTPDFELINLVQEMMGFLIMDNFYATGAFFLYGRGKNGKSVLSSLIEKIFGDEYTSAMSLADFNKPFAVGDIINKKVNISNEEDDRYISGKMFKVLVTGESLRGEHKFGNGYKMRSTCRFLFSTNKLPTFDGLDEGLKRRIFIIPFYRMFSVKEQDKKLGEKLEAEIPGIIGWAIEGAKRLAANNYEFSYSRASRSVFKEFEEEMSSAIMFFNENYVLDDEVKVAKQDLYDHYLTWTKENGKKGTLSRKRFMKELTENIEGLQEVTGHGADYSSYRAFNCRRFNPNMRDIIDTPLI